jgi:4-azaleucine resistance transporter AzlC
VELRGGAEAGGGGLRATLVTAAPLAAAIAVFGMVFGASASAAMDPLLTVGMSLIVFSGSLQFALIGLLAGGAGPVALLVTTLVLNLRHVVLGAVLRSRLSGAAWRRAVLSYFIVDESFGLALAARRRTAFVLAVSGVTFYLAWQVGTLLGVLGARLVALEDLAGAIFPVLFIGLAAVTARGRDGLLRAVVAALVVALAAFVVPAVHDYAPILAALIVALPSSRSP